MSLLLLAVLISIQSETLGLQPSQIAFGQAGSPSDEGDVLVYLPIIMRDSGLVSAPPSVAVGDEEYKLTGRIIDNFGVPIEGALVTAESTRRALEVRTSTDANGGYVLSLREGSYTITFQRAGFDFDGTSFVATIDGSDETAQEVTGQRESTDIQKFKVSGLGDKVARDAEGRKASDPIIEYDVTGFVVDGVFNLPLKGVTVSAEAEGKSFTSDVTNGNGKYKLKLPDGKYTIKFTKRGLNFKEADIELKVKEKNIKLEKVSPKVPTINLALNKPTTQSSVLGSAGSDLAVDGDIDGDYAKGSVSRTKRENQPWWQVDLGAGKLNKSFHISRIILFNRTDCCEDNLRNVHIFVSDSDMTGKSLAKLRQDPTIYHAEITDPIDVKFDQSIDKVGRFVRVQLDGDRTSLSLAEVRVLGNQVTNGDEVIQIGQTSAKAVAIEKTGDTAEFIVKRFGDLPAKIYHISTSSSAPKRSSEFEQLKTIALGESQSNQVETTVAGPEDYEIRDGNGKLLTGSISFKKNQSEALIRIEAIKDKKSEVPELLLVAFDEVPGTRIEYIQPMNVRVIDDRPGITQNSKLFVGEYRPENRADTSASGYVSIRLSGDNAYAEVTARYSGLTTPQTMDPETASHIHFRGNGSVVESLPTGQIFKYKWNIKGGSAFTDQQVLNHLLNGKLYVNVHTDRYPAGEIRADLSQRQGTVGDKDYPGYGEPAYETLTGDELERDIYRFLSQATFGPTPELVNDLKKRVRKNGGDRRKAYEEWIDDQLALESPSLVTYIESARIRYAAGHPDDPFPRSQVINVIGSTHDIGDDGWLTGATYAKAQLRERMTFALSQIIVVGQNDLLLGTNMAVHHDNLNNNAFGSFEDLLYDVSRSAPMSVWLTYYQNQAVYDGKKLTIPPDENYAREIMQLFSIGLLDIHEDGTLKLGKDGLPQQSYTQKDISELARVFTGWSSAVHVIPIDIADRIDPQKQQNKENLLFKRELTYVPSQPIIFAADIKTPLKNFDEFHDPYAKSVLGHKFPKNKSGDEELKQVANMLSEHENTAPFIAYRLIQRFTTSNPSPKYVYRVAQKFEENAGKPDQLAQTVKQILLDAEARNLDHLEDYSVGKIQEPLMRVVAYCRFVRCDNSQSNEVSKFSDMQSKFSYNYSERDVAKLFDSDVENVLINRGALSPAGQRPYKSPTVFNWFEPDYTEPGDLSSGGLVAPELQHYNEGIVVKYHNLIQMLVLNPKRVKLTATVSGWASPELVVSLPKEMVEAYMDVMDTNNDNTLNSADAAFKDQDAAKRASEAVLNVADLYFCGGRLLAESTGDSNSDPHTIIEEGLYEIYKSLDGKNGADAISARNKRIIRAMYFVMVAPQCMVQK